MMAHMNDDEQEVVRLVAQGIINGRANYGELKTASDNRDFVRETLEEVRDSLVYIGAKLVQLDTK